MKNIIKTITFCTVFCIVFTCATTILKAKWLYPNNLSQEAATQFEDGFYAEEKNTMDVIYLGSSAAYVNINPIEIWKKQGITGYTLGSSMQRMWISEYYLKETLKRQNPKVVVLEMYSTFLDDKNNENRNRKALDYMKFSTEKMSAIKNSITKEEKISDYVFPILRYHSRWGEVEKQDFEYLLQDKMFFAKGNEPAFGGNLELSYEFEKSDETPQKISDNVKKHLDTIVDICKEQNIELLLVKTPCFIEYPREKWTRGKSQAVKNYAEEKEITFLEYNEMLDETGIIKETDFSDSVHMNVTGAEKLSAHLGKYIKENYFPKGYENEKVDKEEWNLCYEKYQELKIANELNSETDPTQYIKKLQNPDYIISIVTKGVMNNDDKALGDKLAQLGLEQITNRNENDNYVAVIEKGKTIFEKIGNEKIEYFNKNIDDMPYLIRCLPTNYWGDISILLDKKEVCQNQRGINLVVYDTKLDMVVDSCCFADENTISREQ